MRFSTEQYDQAIASLQDAKKQLEPDGHCCSVCGDNDHMAFECGHNPLFAMAMCRSIAQQSEELHQSLHTLAGWDFSILGQVGPARVVVPTSDATAGDDGEKFMAVYGMIPKQFRVAVCEGGGEPDWEASVCVSIAKMREALGVKLEDG